jgi:hypothetical protein
MDADVGTPDVGRLLKVQGADGRTLPIHQGPLGHLRIMRHAFGFRARAGLDPIAEIDA